MALLIDLHELVGDDFFLSFIFAAISRNIAPFVVILSSGGKGVHYVLSLGTCCYGSSCLSMDHGLWIHDMKIQCNC